MTPEIFSEPVLLWLGAVPVTPTMVTSLVTSLLLLGVGALLARAVVHRRASTTAALGRLLYRFLHQLASDAIGRASAPLEVFAGSLFLFIAACAVLGQLPNVSAPTANLAATSALAAIVFFAVPVVGFHARGLRGYLAEYFKPNPLLFPLHIISEISRTLALALRLFGNMMSGHLVVGLIVALVGMIVPVPLMALDLMIGLLQAYIFTILASVYVGAALQVEQGEHP